MYAGEVDILKRILGVISCVTNEAKYTQVNIGKARTSSTYHLCRAFASSREHTLSDCQAQPVEDVPSITSEDYTDRLPNYTFLSWCTNAL